MQSVFILGSTGSIGTQTLEVIKGNPDKLTVFGLTANKNWKLLAKQIREFSPKVAVLVDSTHAKDLQEATRGTETMLYFGEGHIVELVADNQVDVVMNSLVGFSGFMPTYHALKNGKRVALANKESLVVGGELLQNYIGFDNPKLFPVDSEHSAILQCLVGESFHEIEKIIITASGGPFRDYTAEQLHTVTVESALKHPNWEMGAKITIDSATMMNKGLEVIEAAWLFGLPLDKIEAVIHPQSIIHSMVTFVDGSTKAQLGLPDMKVPIQYALTYPTRWEADSPRLDWTESQNWTFRPINENLYPCFRHALDAFRSGGYGPAVLNAANEVAVERFLNKEIPYIGIPLIVEKSLENIRHSAELSVESIIEVDRKTRNFATTLTI